MSAFSVGDPVVWRPNETEAKECVVAAIDKQTSPHVFVVRFPDGSKRCAREQQLEKASPADPAADVSKETVSKRFTGMATKLFGQVSEKAQDLSKSAQKTFTQAQEKARERMNKDKETDNEAPIDAPPPQHESASSSEEAEKEEEGTPEGTAAATLTAPADEEEERKVAQLVAFGHPAHNARSALILADGDIERAVAFLHEQEGMGEGEGEDEDEDEGASSEDIFGGIPAQQQQAPAAVAAPSPAAVDPFADFAPSAQPVKVSPTPAAAAPAAPAPQRRESDMADAFGFLDAAAPVVRSGGGGGDVPVAGASPLTLVSEQAGVVTLRVTPSALPRNADNVISHFAIGVRIEGEPAWRHFVDSRTNRAMLLSDATADWTATSYPHKASGDATVVVELDCFPLAAAAFEFAARSITPSGPCAPCAPLCVRVAPREALKVDTAGLGAFLDEDFSPQRAREPQPHVPTARTVAYRTHARGEIYDID